jgi:rubredoxin
MAELISEPEFGGAPPTGSDKRRASAALARFAEALAAAEQLSRFRCSGCGYGASCRLAPARCPMCGGGNWEEYGQRPRLPDLDRVFRAL